MRVSDITKFSATGKVLITLYIISNPFYLWRSGLPQLADLILLLLIGWTFVDSTYRSRNISKTGNKSIFSQKYLILIVGFVYFATLVNLVWALIYPEKFSFIRSSVFLLFNLFTLISMAYLVNKYSTDFIRVLQKAIISSIVLQAFLAVLMIGTQGQRTRLFFNNPNQLGYFAVLAAAILTVLYAFRRISLTLHILSLFICVFLTAASLSRGAIVAVLILVVCALIFEVEEWRLRFRFSLKKTALVGALSISLILLLQSPLQIMIDSWGERSEAKSSTEGLGLGDRGYERILENVKYWVLGAGEGGLSRFNTNLELHSLFGNIFFSYGLIGFILFVGTILVIVRGHPGSLIPFSAVIMYGFSHNGLRDGLLWMLIAICGSLVLATKESIAVKSNLNSGRG